MTSQLSFITLILLLMFGLMLYSFGIQNQYFADYDHEYLTKFTCGTIYATSTQIYPLNSGLYTTAVNIYNTKLGPVEFTKEVILSPREPAAGTPSAPTYMTLQGSQATNADCYDIRTIMGEDPNSTIFIEGFVRIISPEPLDVASVYTSQGMDPNGNRADETNIDVEHDIPERLRTPQ